MSKTDLRITIIAMMVLMTACQDRNQSPAVPSPTVPLAARQPAQRLRPPLRQAMSQTNGSASGMGRKVLTFFLPKAAISTLLRSSRSTGRRPMKELPPETASNSSATARLSLSARGAGKRPG